MGQAQAARRGAELPPPSLALRKEAIEARAAAVRAPSEAEARRIIDGINDTIREANRTGIRGPSLMLVPFNVERILLEWRTTHSS